MKLPAFQFYPGDWRKDPNLCRCSHAAKGVWIDMICLMHSDSKIGMYVSGCRRNYIKSQSSGGDQS
jgi:hypothetical protein